MVLAERNSELVRNGRRSRGPSPNGAGGGGSGGGSIGGAGTGVVSAVGNGPGGAGTPETSSDDDNSIKRNGKSKSKQSEYEEKIRVGRDYQAVCPSLIPEPERKPEVLNDRALLVWSPTKEIPDTRLEEYISVAKEKYGYNGEQALGMLFWHKHDLERAVMDLANFTPFPDEWTVEDKVLFEQAFQFHGKSFHRIRQMLPDKSIASLVKYYYSWKKTRHRQSVMDRQEKAKASKEGSENGSENGSNEESDSEDKEQVVPSTTGTVLDQQQLTSKLLTGNGSGGVELLSNANDADQLNESTAAVATPTLAVTGAAHISSSTAAPAAAKHHQQQQQRQQTPPTDSSSGAGRTTPLTNGSAAGQTGSGSIGSGSSGGCCTNCGVPCNDLHGSPHGKLCYSCHHHWRRTGNKRPTSGPFIGKRMRDRNTERHKRKPPRGMYINHDDIVALASANDTNDGLLSNIDREIATLLSQVQLQKQTVSSLKRKLPMVADEMRPLENVNRINARWSNDEHLMAIQGVRKYGKDFQTIAETLGTKTEAHVRTFYMNHRRRYNLDHMAKQHEAEKDAVAVTATVTSAVDAAVGGAASGTAASPSVLGITTANTAAAVPEVVAMVAKKEEQQKKKETGIVPAAVSAAVFPSVASVVADESDNTTASSETNNSKTTTTLNDEAKSSSSSSSNAQKDNVIMEIDLDAEQGDYTATPPAAKKIALAIANLDCPKASAV